MRWSELDEDLSLWTLPRDKNDVEHQVPIAPEVRGILAALPRNGDYVLTTSGRAPISGYSKTKIALDAAIAELNGPHRIRITLPNDYFQNSNARYPVLYLLHGGAGGEFRPMAFLVVYLVPSYCSRLGS